MEREFYVDDTHILFRRPTKTKLDSPPISETTLFGKLYHRLGPYLVMGIPLAYPIQRLFSDTGGVYAVLLLLTVLCTPLTFWVLGRMSCGAYLNIYKVWELEKKHGKPVLFEPS